MLFREGLRAVDMLFSALSLLLCTGTFLQALTGFCSEGRGGWLPTCKTSTSHSAGWGLHTRDNACLRQLLVTTAWNRLVLEERASACRLNPQG